MRSLLMSSALGLSGLGILGAVPSEAGAQWRSQGRPQFQTAHYPNAPYVAYWTSYRSYHVPPIYYPPMVYYAYPPVRYQPPYYVYPSTPYPGPSTIYAPPLTSAPAWSATPSTASVVQVTIGVRDNYFEQPMMTVSPGTTVRWINHGQHAHTVTSDNGLFGSADLHPGESYRSTFHQVGAYPYYCAHHPQMRGTIVVQ